MSSPASRTRPIWRLLPLTRSLCAGNCLSLIHIYNDCPAFDFDAELEIQARQDHLLSITWRKGGACARLEADLSTYAFAADTDVDGRHFHFAQEG